MKAAWTTLSPERRAFLTDSLHLFVLWGFAVAQPLYDVLGKSAEFFVAHRTRPGELLLLVLVLSLALPGLLVLMEFLVGLLGRAPRRVLHGVLAAALVAVVALPPLKKVPGLSDVSIIVLAGVAGGLFAATYFQFSGVRLFCSVLAPAFLIFPALFLLASPVAKLLRPVGAVAASVLPLKQRPPIVMVVFDEFSSVYLMDEKEEIDAERYPNFAALAKGAYWFRNATTVNESTLYAVPAILTGRFPPQKEKKLPIAAEYPDNLFTFLAGSYQLNVWETSELCPAQLCSRVESNESSATKLLMLSSDVSFVGLHIALPHKLASELPPLTDAWKGFGNAAASPLPDFLSGRRAAEADHADRKAIFSRFADRKKLFSRFVQSIYTRGQPSLNFLHVLLPHSPFMYLPSGKVYSQTAERGRTGAEGKLWIGDEWTVTTVHQRYILQLQFVDRLIGELTAALRQEGLYDRALIIVTADHGISFRAGDNRRIPTESNVSEILGVPLFMKLPHQEQGFVCDRNVQIVDILPSIADVVGVELPWQTDGISVFDNSSAHKEKILIQGGAAIKQKRVFPSDFPEKKQGLRDYLARFGTGRDPYGLFRIGPYREFVGRDISQLGQIKTSQVRVTVDQESLLSNVDTGSDFLPVLVSGSIDAPRTARRSHDVAIAVNNVVYAVTRTFERHGEPFCFEALLPESALRARGNDVEIFLIEPNSSGYPILVKIRTTSVENFRLVRGQGGEETLVSEEGRFLAMRPEAVRGGVGRIRVQSSLVTFAGWAADMRSRRPAKRVLLFAGDRHLYSVTPAVYRKDLGKALGGGTDLDYSGFVLSVPIELLAGAEGSSVRLFALAHDGTAREFRLKPEDQSILEEALGITNARSSASR